MYSIEELKDKVQTYPARLSEDYDKYLLSKDWRKKKVKVHRRDGFRCQVCGDVRTQECHHLTYERIFVEKYSDLITLCQSCHRKVHRS